MTTEMITQFPDLNKILRESVNLGKRVQDVGTFVADPESVRVRNRRDRRGR